MARASLVDDVTSVLHSDPQIKRWVGHRVVSISEAADLPNIVVVEAEGGSGHQVVLTCRATTSNQADRIGAAVKSALVAKDRNSKGAHWVAIQDRSGYDSSAKAFRRVISLTSRAR